MNKKTNITFYPPKESADSGDSKIERWVKESGKKVEINYSPEAIVASHKELYEKTNNIIEVLSALEIIVSEYCEWENVDGKWLIEPLRKNFGSQVTKARERRALPTRLSL